MISPPTSQPTTGLDREAVLADYRLAYQSRQASLIGRREVLTGKAKFGIFGDGKEVAQVALARVVQPGDVRSGYYRDQTLMMALGQLTLEAFFAQLYADPDPVREPMSGGRQMTAHFATKFLDEAGRPRDLTQEVHSSADLSPTGSQMPRLVGLAFASKLYRQLEPIPGAEQFSRGGDEIAFGTIGNASCAEGLFWESINAAAVLQVPMLLSIWDDGYGISVPNEFQVAKGDLSAALSGFQRGDVDGERGLELTRVAGWSYPDLLEAYQVTAARVREEHVPAVVHVVDMTQPQGHSTSGSHERYKSEQRLQWEAEWDCVVRMRTWMAEQGFVTDHDLDELEKEALTEVKAARQRAWDTYRDEVDGERSDLVELIESQSVGSGAEEALQGIVDRVARKQTAGRRDLLAAASEARIALGAGHPGAAEITRWRDDQLTRGAEHYSTHLYAEGQQSTLNVLAVPPQYREDAPELRGFEILNQGFDALLARDPRVIAFGEDLGQLGDVNQGFAGLQEKYGALRVSDTGIREATILGQAIGAALRGFRPIAEIQYLDYLLYALQIVSDDLATTRWRTRGRQSAPVVVRTRGHRLEGVWHSGSPMAGLMHLVRGVHLCVPRDMVTAVGMYNTLMHGEDPAILVEVLNGYRLRERVPSNLSEFTVALGVPEVLREGRDLTLVTYGACCRLALEAAELLDQVGIDAEIVDVQTLLPLDVNGRIVESLRKTNRLLVVDEDVPGGASATIVQHVVEKQGGFDWLDAEPQTLTAQAHRPAYGSDGDYFSKPNRDTIFDAAYELMRKSAPERFPAWP